TLSELLTLRRPYDGASDLTVRERVLAEESAPPQKFSVMVPADLAAVCRKAMRKDPAKRYASAQALADDLRRWLRHEPVRARPAWAWRRLKLWTHRNPGWAAAMMLLM